MTWRFPFVFLFALAASFAAHSAEYRVTAADGAANNAFGADVAASGSRVVIGSPGASVGDNAQQGAVYVYEREGCALREVAKLIAADGASGDAFGTRVAISGDVIVVSAPGAQADARPDHGAVYVFERRDDEWVQAAKLFSADTLANAGYGAAIATDGRRVLVGAPQAHGSSGAPGSYLVGAVYAYERDGGEWRARQRFTSPLEAHGAEFGAALAMDDELAVVSQPAANNANGEVFVFERDDDAWEFSDYITAGSGGAGVALGAALAMDGEYFATGAPGGETNDTHLSGAVYVFEWGRRGADLDGALAPGAWDSGDAFGSALAFRRDHIAVASTAGRVHVFERRRSWRETATHAAPPDAGGFGRALAWSGEMLLIGAPLTHMGGNAEQGAVYVRAPGA